MGLKRLSGGIMLKRFLPAVFCSVLLFGKIHAQEVIVAHEKKTEPARHTPQPSEEPTSELTTPTPSTPRKPKSRQKKPARATLTLEQMRAAGARAAEGPNARIGSRSTIPGETNVEVAPPPNPTVAESPKPSKRETPAEERRSSRASGSRPGKIEESGPIRPTLMESGRETSSPSPR